MSTKGEVLRHPINGSIEQTWDGFSWPAFFFGLIWMAVKELYGHFLVALLIAVLTGGFAAPIIWIVYGFMGNGFHKTPLLKKGYLTEQQWSEKGQAAAPAAAPAPLVATPAHRDHAAQLRDLVELRDKGALTDAEFAA